MGKLANSCWGAVFSTGNLSKSTPVDCVFLTLFFFRKDII